MARFLGFYCIHQYSSSWFSCACPVLLQQVWLGMGTFLRRSKHWIRTEDPLLYETTVPVFCSCCHCHYLYLWYYYISVEIKRPGEMIPVIVSPGFFLLLLYLLTTQMLNTDFIYLNGFSRPPDLLFNEFLSRIIFFCNLIIIHRHCVGISIIAIDC